MNQTHCEDAIAALRRIDDTETNLTTRVLARMLKADEDACATIKEIIELLQSDAIVAKHDLHSMDRN